MDNCRLNSLLSPSDVRPRFGEGPRTLVPRRAVTARDFLMGPWSGRRGLSDWEWHVPLRSRPQSWPPREEFFGVLQRPPYFSPPSLVHGGGAILIADHRRKEGSEYLNECRRASVRVVFANRRVGTVGFFEIGVPLLVGFAFMYLWIVHMLSPLAYLIHSFPWFALAFLLRFRGFC